MKSRFQQSLAAAALLAVIFTPQAFSQSIKYNDDVEVGVVTTRDYDGTVQINLATSQGVYFSKPKIFVGAGAAIGWNMHAEYWKNVFPVYGDIRKDFTLTKRFTAFIDAKAGYTIKSNMTAMICDCGLNYGFYCYPSAGVRFSLIDRFGVFLKIGYTYQEATSSYQRFANHQMISGSSRINTGGFSASIGFSF